MLKDLLIALDADDYKPIKEILDRMEKEDKR